MANKEFRLKAITLVKDDYPKLPVRQKIINFDSKEEYDRYLNTTVNNMFFIETYVSLGDKEAVRSAKKRVLQIFLDDIKKKVERRISQI